MREILREYWPSGVLALLAGITFGYGLVAHSWSMAYGVGTGVLAAALFAAFFMWWIVHEVGRC